MCVCVGMWVCVCGYVGVFSLSIIFSGKETCSWRVNFDNHPARNSQKRATYISTKYVMHVLSLVMTRQGIDP